MDHTGAIRDHSKSRQYHESTLGDALIGHGSVAAEDDSDRNTLSKKVMNKLHALQREAISEGSNMSLKLHEIQKDVSRLLPLLDTAQEVQNANPSTDFWNSDRAMGFLLPKSEDPMKYVGERRKALGKLAWDITKPFINESTAVALNDGRPLIIAPFALQHAGHGNAHFVTAGMTALAYRFNMLPVVPCRKNGKLNTSPIYNYHCVNEKAIKWKGFSDGGGIANLGYQQKLEQFVKTKVNVFINGYFQYFHGFSYASDAICWAFHPNEATQQDVKAYFDETVVGNLSDIMDEHSRVVAVHVRRGDYVSDTRKELHGALSTSYYTEAWAMLQARIALENELASKNLLVLVFAAENSIEWAGKHLRFPGAKAVRIVRPNQKGRGPAADIDMLALSLADYFILSNSTFCWWASFYSECRKRFTSWWMLPWAHPRAAVRDRLMALPHRWHKLRDTTTSLTFNFMMDRYIIPRTKDLYEGVPSQ